MAAPTTFNGRLSDEYFGFVRGNEEMNTIQAERSRASFPVREMTYFLDHGEEETRYKELANTLISRDPYLMKKRPFDLTSREDREKTMQQIRRAINVMKNIKDPKLSYHFQRQMSLYDRSYQMRMYVHWMLFRETIWAQGTKEQFAEWEPLIRDMKVIGCFSMTELGYSSFLRGCETYAIYDKSREEFIINSASILATKWWIGMAGDAATHTVALCNLVIDGQIKGLYWFIVPLRSLVDGSLLPGVTAGFLGPRAGRSGLDNGWIQFTHVRVPRNNMLMKWGQVSADGSYTALANQALSYGSLIGERIFALEEMQAVLSIGTTISVRYAAIRRQGEKNQQVLDYQSHQHALFPIVAFAYALRFMASDLIGSWSGVQMEFEKTGDEKAYIGQIQDYHAIAAGLKAILGWWTADSMESIRRTLGGHAYSAYNAISGLIGDFAVVTTGGGDNTILAQQCARYLISSVKRASEGKPLGKSVRYLKDVEADSPRVFKAMHPHELRDSTNQLSALAWLSHKMVTTAGMTLASLLGSGSDMNDAWNNHMVELIESIRPHSLYYAVKTFVAAVESMRHNEKLYNVLSKVSSLFALVSMKQCAQHFLEHGYMTPEQVKLIRQEIVVICRELRPDGVALVDAFNYPDWLIKAPLGQADGNIYEAYLNNVKEGNPPGNTSYYWREIAPQLHSKM